MFVHGMSRMGIGSCSLRFLGVYLLLATSNTHAVPQRCNNAKHVHLSVGSDPATSMTISFASGSCSHGKQPGSYPIPPIGAVSIGTTPEKLDTDQVWTAQHGATSYNATLPIRRGGGDYKSDFFHHVTVKDLTPNTRYYYRCFTVEREAGGYEGTTRQLKPRPRPTHAAQKPQDYIASFVTAPVPGDGLGTTKFAIVGDLGQTQFTMNTLDHIEEHKEEYSAIFLAGDIAYSEYDHRGWDRWFELLDEFPIISELPLQVAAGNHDIDVTEPSGEIFVAYEHRFAMPQVQPAEMSPYHGPKIPMYDVPYPLDYDYGNAYYAFKYGPSHNIVVCSYCSFNPGSKQYKWLVAELKSVDRSVTPWLLVMLHVPMYNTFMLHRRDKQLTNAKKHLEPLFVKYQVNVVFAGHIHAYMRTEKVAFDELNENGPVHIVAGDAGGKKCNAPFFSKEPEEWLAVRDSTIYGYGSFEMINKTHARWDWIHTGKERSKNQICKKKNVGCVPLPGGGEDHYYLTNQFF